MKTSWDALKAHFVGWHPTLQTVIDAADKDQCYLWSLHNRPPIRNWSTARVTLLGEFFFAGRLVALDHGLGLYTLYFHLDGVSVAEGQMVERGQTIGTVGTTGRSTGPHLHFAVQLGRARINPPDLYALPVRD